MRVIAGSAGGIRLSVPKRGVRPTMDRVKAAIFSSLGDATSAREFSTFFREQASEFAQPCLFCFCRRRSTINQCHRENLAKQNSRRVRHECSDFLRYASGTEKFQIIFADPPYEQTKSDERFTEKLVTSKTLGELLAPEGVFVLEKRPGERLPETKLWRVARQKTYGATEVLFLSASASPARTDPQSAFDDSFYIQFALAHRVSVLFAGLFDENGSSRRLPRKIRSAPGNLRPRLPRPAPEWREEANMAACSQRGRSHVA
jgi:16S rRNA (guanine966-N2)-methyltransferase